MSEEAKAEPLRRILLTGFGKFHGVDDNPTTKIVQYLQANESTELACFKGCCFTMDVLEVSVDGVQAQIDYSGGGDTSYDLYLHLGVDSGAQKVKLEECAYNNMSFRCADERGYNPEGVTINGTCTLDEPLKTAFDVAAICNVLATTGRTSPDELTTSTNPGRFLCNYVYYRSLLHKRNMSHPPNALFIHVPSEQVISIPRQVEIVKEVLTQLVQQI